MQTEQTIHDISEKGLSETVSSNVHKAQSAVESADQRLLGGKLTRLVNQTKAVAASGLSLVKGSGSQDLDTGFSIVLTSTAFPKIQGANAALEQMFQGAFTLRAVPCASTVANQPVGFAAGRAGAEGRVASLRSAEEKQPHEIVLSIENFLVETTPGQWFDMAHVTLVDDANQITVPE